MKLNLINFKFFSSPAWLFPGLLLLGLCFDNLADQNKTSSNPTKQINPVNQAKIASAGPNENIRNSPKITSKSKQFTKKNNNSKKTNSFKKITKNSIVPKIPDIVPKNSHATTPSASSDISELEEFILDDITGLKINGAGLTAENTSSSLDNLTAAAELVTINSNIESDIKSSDITNLNDKNTGSETIAMLSSVSEELVTKSEKPVVVYHGRYKPRQSILKKALFLTKDFNDLNSEEVSERTKEHLANQDYRSAATCVEREMALCKNHNQICKLRLVRADIWLAAGDVEKAASGYREFIAQYPSHPQTEYAKYKLIKILFDAMPTCDRDQSGTSEALQTAREFLTNTTYTKYREEVEKISQRCYCQLFDSEVKKFEFYVNHRHFLAANKRFKYIEKTYPEFPVEIAELQKWLTAMETGKSYILPENMRSKRTKKHYYGAKKRNYGAMF
jgi:outer membrane assembly lipoprotein YfiO